MIYIYIIYLESHNVANGFPRKVLMQKSSMRNLLKPWSLQASVARTRDASRWTFALGHLIRGGYLATDFLAENVDASLVCFLQN